MAKKDTKVARIDGEESPLPDGVAEDLHGKHGPVVAFDAGQLGAFAFRGASQAATDRIVNKVADSFEKAQALREFVLTCLCYPVDTAGKPDYAAARALFEAAPGLPADLLSEIQDLAPKFDIKKL